MSETELRSYYKVDTLFPDEYPEGHDDAQDSSDDESLVPEPRRPARVTSKSRFSALGSKRTSVPGAQRTNDGLENLVQKDEPDPLGSSNSVITTLRRKGIAIEQDSKLRNRYLLSSTTFSAPLFLSQVHSDASTEDLVQGLNFLSQAIEEKSESLKFLVESNFEKFVRAKSTIDNVYKEMVTAGNEPEQPGRKSHSRQTSRQSAHFRKASVQIHSSLSQEKRKNALTKDQDFGVLPIKVPLLELKNKVDEVWGPALGGRDREDHLKVLMGSVEKRRSVFEIGAAVAEAIRRKEYDTIMEEYVKAKRLADETRNSFKSIPKESLTDEDVLNAVITARMWADVEKQIETFKRDVWRRLSGTHLTKHGGQADDKPEEYMELISILLELGVDDNPIYVWLFSRYDYLKQKITGTFERSKVEIEILRRRLSYGEEPTQGQLAMYLRSATPDGHLATNTHIDSSKVLELWEHVYSCLNGLLSTQGGILGEVIEFWETTESFIAGTAQKDLPVGIEGNSRKHHRLSVDGMKALDGGAQDLINLIREHLVSFFTETPIEDLSLLLSPNPDTPQSPNPKSPNPNTPKTPKSTTIQTFSDARLRVDVSNIPPPSPSKNKSWERYAFWPPYSTSLSGVYYLGKIMHLIGTAACDMAGLRIIGDGKLSLDTYKLLVGSIRERCVEAACAAWGNDCEMFGVLEDWTRSPERPEHTKFPLHMMNFESFMLHHLQKIMFVSETTKRPTSPDIILPPSSKLLQMVRSQFVGGLLKIISAMKDTAEASHSSSDATSDGLITPLRDPQSGTESSGVIDATNKSVRLLLTLSNVQGIRSEGARNLVSLYESTFTVKLTDEITTVNDALKQLDARLFHAYVTPIIAKTDALVKSSIASQEWAPRTSRPTDARAYVYDLLLGLVLVHTEVSTTAAPLTAPILKHLLEKHLVSLLEAFGQRSKYSLPALMQATLDVEFLAQTLSNYTTEKAGKTQSDIYILLDARTDDDARLRLQRELQELRSILKRLREGTRTEFACFKRQKSNARASERIDRNSERVDRNSNRPSTAGSGAQQ